jgi:ribosomal protein L11 methyltransferase
MPALWRMGVVVPADAASAMATAFEGFCASVSLSDDGYGRWRVDGLTPQRPQRAAVEVAVALAAARSGGPNPEVAIEPVVPQDWVAESRRQMPAFRAGRYFVRGSHVAVPPRDGRIDICVDAGIAFGSGHHESTLGCLKALDRMAHRRFRRPLDLGCGSGILAIAIAKTWSVPTLATDIDPAAVDVCRENARLNGVGPLVRAAVADGLTTPMVSTAGPFDLVVANILARPLRRLAGPLGRAVAPGGRVVLAGFIEPSAARVIAAYRAHGFGLVERIALDNWRTLVLARR